MESELAQSIASAASLEMLPEHLRTDLCASLDAGVRDGARLASGEDPEAAYRHAVAQAVAKLEQRDKQLRRFLTEGPYEGEGPIPASLRESRLSDEECASAIAFIHSHVVNAFQGSLAELLSVGPCVSLITQLRQRGELPSDARLYVGDAVRVARSAGAGTAKGADLHLLSVRGRTRVVVHGVGEVKSYRCSQSRLRGQLRRHVDRAGRGMFVGSRWYPSGSISPRGADADETLTVGVVPASWRLSRRFSFRTVEDRTLLESEPSLPTRPDAIRRTSPNSWRVVLRWSHEALAAVAHELSFWYMGELGERLFETKGSSPWPEMTPRDAGRNAVKMMLYYAMLRCPTARDQQRAVALYNSYGFGYALGTSFCDRSGRRAMLWPEDLRQILAAGVTQEGCRLRE